MPLDYPLWLRAAHFFNFLLLSLLIRSGLEILSAHPWSGVAEWGGVSLHHIVGLCRPLPAVRYIVFYAFDNKSTSEPHAQGSGYFYGTIRLELAEDPQTILAYEMNGQPLPILHGAPLRLRVETQLGFTMVKYIRAIEFIEDYKTIGQGQGGWREDYQYFSQEAGI